MRNWTVCVLGLIAGAAMWASFAARLVAAELSAGPSAGYSIPLVDLADDWSRRVIVDREPGQYLGHPTTVLLEDGRTMLIVYPKGHGKGAIVLKRSTDGGLSWSARQPTPVSWDNSQEAPTLYRVVDRQGAKRLILFSGFSPIRMAVSENDGLSWSELKPIGDFGGIVAMGCLAKVRQGDYLALFHDDGRFLHAGGKATSPATFHVYQTNSTDGGLSWSAPRAIAAHPKAQLCEPGLIRSPRELPGALTGDRHAAKYAADGRLFVTFRDTTRESSTKGDWVAWLGKYEDIVAGREGACRIRLLKNHKGYDCAYPGLESLPDGTLVTTTYGHWTPNEQPYIVSVRLRLEEIDARLAALGGKSSGGK
jgi:hypothetical protein